MSGPEYDVVNGTWGGGAVGPRFELRSVKDEAASEAAGKPQFREVEYIRLLVAGDKYNQPMRPARPDDIAKYAKEYEAFKRGLQAPVDGMPLEEWPAMTTTTVNNLRSEGYRTVEQVAAVPDTELGKLGPYGSYRDQAKKWLEGGGMSDKKAKSLADENADLKRQLAALTASDAGKKGK